VTCGVLVNAAAILEHFEGAEIMTFIEEWCGIIVPAYS